MALKDILVPYNGQNTANCALKQAILLAEKHAAHVTACFPYDPPAVVSTARQLMSKRLEEQFHQIVDRMEVEARSAIRQAFDEQVAGVSVPERVHSLEIIGNSDIAVTKAARHFDVTFIGQNLSGYSDGSNMIHPDVIALRSGKPVLVVPHRDPSSDLARRVVIAWDGKRAAARAVGEAMQLFGPFADASVLRVGSQDASADYWAKQLCTNLSRHGTQAEDVSKMAKGSVAQTILDHCADFKADLLVMGAYEHSKFSEDILGGTTNDVLSSLIIPCFMAH